MYLLLNVLKRWFVEFLKVWRKFFEMGYEYVIKWGKKVILYIVDFNDFLF